MKEGAAEGAFSLPIGVGASVHHEAWDLTPADRLLVEARRWGNRLRFAVMLLFYRAQGRFPRNAAEVDKEAVAELACTLGVSAADIGAALPGPDNRTLKRQRAEIRALLGFREATVADAESLSAWLRDTTVARTRNIDELTAHAEARCRALRLEPPTRDRLGRIVRGAMRAYDERHYAAVHAQLAPDTRARLDALVQPRGPGSDDAENEAAEGQVDALLIQLRAGPGRASVASLREELAWLDTVRQLGLPAVLFADWNPAELEACRQRVAVEAPYELGMALPAMDRTWRSANFRGTREGKAARLPGTDYRRDRYPKGRAGSAGTVTAGPGSVSE